MSLSMEKLVERLFFARTGDLRKLLQPLAEKQRSALFKESKTIIKTLRDVCIAFPADFGKTITLKQLYEQLMPAPQLFVGRWPEIKKKKGGILAGFGDDESRFFTRIQLAQVALAPKSQVLTGLKTGRFEWWEDASYIPAVGGALLDRPEPWAQELMVEFFTHFETWVSTEAGGSWRLYQEVCEAKPHWCEALSPFAGKVMARDGFWRKKIFQSEVGAATVLAGLGYDLPREAWRVPILDEKVTGGVMQWVEAGRIPRQDLHALILEKLLAPRRPGEVKAWLGLYHKLAPDDAEIDARQEVYIDLINAGASPVAQLAIKVMSGRLKTSPALAAGLIQPLAYALSHEVQAVANKALALLKQIVKTDKNLITQALNAAVAALATPNAAFRAKLIGWLKGFDAAQFDSAALDELAALAAGLKQQERLELQQLLPQSAGPEQEETQAGDPAAQLSRWLAGHGGSDARSEAERRRIDFLRRFNDTGEVGALDALKPDHSAALQDEPFSVFETAEALATAMQKALGGFSWCGAQQLERFLEGVVRLREHGQRSDIRDQLLSRLVEPEEDDLEAQYRFSMPARITQALIKIWCHSETTPAVFDPDKTLPPVFHLDSSINCAMFMARAAALPALLEHNHTHLLATPTHQTGWLQPLVFAERYVNFPHSLLDTEELAFALLRLPRLAGERERAWQLLKPRLDPDALFDQAVTLALAPVAPAVEAARAYAQHMLQHPPDEPLCFAGGWLGAGNRSQRQWQAYQARNNRIYRLFHAALRARFGLGDVRAWLHEAAIELPAPAAAENDSDNPDSDEALAALLEEWLPAEEFADLPFDDILAGAKEGMAQTGKQQPQLNALFAGLLLHPQAITRGFIEQHAGNETLRWGAATAYPLLVPYLCACSQNMMEFGARADGPVFNFPALAQRFFEIGASRVDEPGLFSDAPQKLLALGELSHVDIAGEIDTVAALLRRKKPREREQAIDLLLVWLQDGRITPLRLADALARMIGTTDKGFTYVGQALASMSAAGPAAGAVVQQAIEQVLGNQDAPLAAKNQSLLLTRLAEVLEDSNRAVFAGAARTMLEQLAAGRKKTVSVSKAREVLAYQGASRALPLTIVIIAHLAGALDV